MFDDDDKKIENPFGSQGSASDLFSDTLKNSPFKNNAGVSNPNETTGFSVPPSSGNAGESSDDDGISFDASYGDLEASKHLYETKLQNVFNDYQQSIETLNRQEKENIKDAYYIRKMSEKYLGNYASNNQIGDVSGNLLDIYGNYQENIGDIRKNFDELELNLQREYQTKRLETLQEIFKTQSDITDAEQLESTNEVLYNIAMGNTSGLNDSDYLDAQLNEGNIDVQSYRDAKVTLHQEEQTAMKTMIYNNVVNGTTDGMTTSEYLDKAVEDDIISPVERQTIQSEFWANSAQEVYSTLFESEFGYYGVKEVDGETQLIEDPYEYLEMNKDRLNPRDYETFKSQLEAKQLIMDDMRESQGFTPVEDENELISADEKDVYFGDQNVLRSTAIQDSNGNVYYQIAEPAGHDEKHTATGVDAQTVWEEKFEDEEEMPDEPRNGDIVTVSYDEVVGEDGNNYQQATQYIYQDGSWYRLETPQEPDDSLWVQPEGVRGNHTGIDFKIYDENFLGDGFIRWRDMFEYKGVKYVTDETVYDFDKPDEVDFNEQGDQESDEWDWGLIEHFQDTHPDPGDDNNIRQNSYVFYNGNIWLYENGKIKQMRKKRSLIE